MLITPTGILALRKLRQELQEEAGLDFPKGVIQEMLVLYDVCKYLELNLFQCKEVLGEFGWKSIHEYING